MKKIIIPLLISSTVYAAKPETSIQCPQGSQVTTREVEAGKVQECLSLTTGKNEGMRLDFDKKNVLRRKWSFKEGLPNGEFQVYDEKSNLIREGKFESGKLTGKMTRWHSNGKLQDVTNWLDGRPHGEVKRFFKNGKVQEEGNYQAGRRVGVWQFKKENGNPLPKRNYDEATKDKIELMDWGALVQNKSTEDVTVQWSEVADVEKRDRKDGPKIFARVDAQSKAPGWTLQFQGKTYQAWDIEERKFTIDVPLDGKSTTVDVVAVGPENKKINYQLEVASQKPEDLAKTAQTQPEVAESGVAKSVKKSQFIAMVGVNKHDYSEGASINADSTNLLVAGRFHKSIFSSRLDFMGTANYEALSLAKAEGVEHLNFINLDGAVGYLTSDLESNWQFGLYLGGLYRASNGTNYGFENLSGPQFSPYLKYKLSQAQAVYGFYHYAPLFTEGFDFSSGEDTEARLEIGWVKTLATGSDLRVIFYSANLMVTSSNSDINSKSNGLLLGYGF